MAKQATQRDQPNYLGNIFVRRVDAGVLEVNIRTGAYPGAAEHWRDQLTGKNAKKWGRIWIDPSSAEGPLKRRMATDLLRSHYRGEVGCNIDECPGAMFLWETNTIAHAEPVDAVSNQALGRDLYFALRRVIAVEMAPILKPMKLEFSRGDMGWWEVRFCFDDFPK